MKIRNSACAMLIAFAIGGNLHAAFPEDSLTRRSAYPSFVLEKKDLDRRPVRSIQSILNSSVPSIYLYGDRWPNPWRNSTGNQQYPPYSYQEKINEHAISRGQEASDLGYYFGGFLLNDRFTGRADLELPYHAFESIEVSNYGLPAKDPGFSGGLVRITPIRPGNEWRLKGEVVSDVAAPMLAASSYGRQIYSASAAGPLSSWLGLAASAQWTLMDDANPGIFGHPQVRILRNRGAGLLDTALIGGFRQGSRPNGVNEADTRSAYGALHIKPARALAIRLDALLMESLRNLFTPEYLLAPDRVPRFERTVFFGGFEGRFEASPQLALTLRAEYQTVSHVVTERSLASKGADAVLMLNARTRGTTGSSTYSRDNLMYDIDRGFIGYDQMELSSWNLGGGSEFSSGLGLISVDFDYRRYEVRSFRLYDQGFPIGGANDYYGYALRTDGTRFIIKDKNDGLDGVKKPMVGHFSVSDQLVFGNLTAHGGIRFDVYDAGTDLLRDLGNPTGPNQIMGPEDFRASKTHIHANLRGGFLARLDELTLHGDVGYYTRPPTFDQTFINTRFLERMSLAPPFFASIGNPTLEPQRTLGWGLGGALNSQSNDVAVHVSGYLYGRQGDHTISRTAIASFPNGMILFTNGDELRVWGIEVMMDLNVNNRFLIGGSGETRISKQVQTDENSGFRAAWLGFSDDKWRRPPDHYTRLDMKFWTELVLTRGEGLEISGRHPFEESTVSLFGVFNSGLPYTPTEVAKLGLMGVPNPRVTGRANSRSTTVTLTFDMKLTKAIRFGDRMKTTFFTEILNIFNRRNVVDVYAGSGRAVVDGFNVAALNARESNQYTALLKDGYHYRAPRTVNMGVVFDF